MPALSLVVCLYREKEMLERLLRESAGLFDDLVVVHDGMEGLPVIGSHQPHQPPAIDYMEANTPALASYRAAKEPEKGSIQKLVLTQGGRYFEGPRSFQQEPHWPFAWSQARYDWILRLDADEFPSDKMREWLQSFRQMESVPPEISGYTCIWPLWDGRREVMHRWPAGRNFLINRRRVRFFGMVEQVPIPDGRWEPLDFSLCHQPRRKSYGLANILWRRQGYLWRMVIAQSLRKEPQDLPRWRWSTEGWPSIWQRLKHQSLFTGFYFLLRDTAATLKAQWRAEKKLMPLMAFATPLHHFLIFRQVRRRPSGGDETDDS